MTVYKSPRGDIYNLDNFAMFTIKNSLDKVTAGNIAHFQLEGHTSSGSIMVIHRGSEKECASELNEIDRLLRLHWSGIVSLSEDTLTRLGLPLMERVNKGLQSFVEGYIQRGNE